MIKVVSDNSEKEAKMATIATVEKQKLTFVKLPKLQKRKECEIDKPITKEEFLQILKDGDERFARGEYHTEDEMWALIERSRQRIHEHYSE